MTARRIAFAWVAALVCGLGLCVIAADPPKAEPPVDPLQPKGRDDALFAAAACAGCHSAEPGDKKAGEDHAYGTRKKLFESHRYILLSEGKRWERSDPHSRAFAVLKDRRETDKAATDAGLGQQIGTKLYRNPDPMTWTACLTCHAVDLCAGDTSVRLDASDKKWKRFETDEGVGCVACHGVRKPWQSAHYQEKADEAEKTQPAWRVMSVATKSEAGLRDLRDPAVKAKLCASCHVGSAELGRVVTHDMYAAGHPPLPPFELATYLEAQPNHWARPTDLDYFKSFKGDTWKQYHFHLDEVSAAREFAAGAVAAVRAEADMLAADAREGDGIDFARFDCLACHHDLKTPSDRQARGYAGPPGRPPLRASVGIVAGVVADHSKTLEPFKTAGDFAPKWKDLRTAVTARPFGDETVGSRADEVRAWCDGFLDAQSRYDKPVYTNEAATALRGRIEKLVEGGLADPEAALVLAWGYTAVSGKNLPAELELRVKDAKAETPLGYKRRQEWVNAFRTDEFTKAFGKLK